MKTVFENDWMQISKTGNKYSIRYNSGDIVNNIREFDVSEEDAVLAQKSDQDAENIIIKYQNIEMGLT